MGAEGAMGSGTIAPWFGPEKKYICTIEDDGKKLMLYAPSDSEFQVDDPTMLFEKVEESD